MEQVFLCPHFCAGALPLPAKGGWNHAASNPLLHSGILPPAGFIGQGHGKRRSSRCQKSRPAVRRNNRQRRGKLLDLRSHGESMAPAAQDHPRQSVPDPEGPADTRSLSGCSRVQRHGVFRVVGASCVSFASAPARKLARCAAPPLQITTASLGCDLILAKESIGSHTVSY